MKLEILEKNSLLYKETQIFDFNKPPFDREEFAVELCNCMWRTMALGLAANQVGYNYRIFSFIGTPESFVCFNPKIVHTFDEDVELEETSLSYPGLVFDIKRPKSIRLRFQAPNTQYFIKTYTGMTARIIQQMMDHLNGVPFWDSISKLKFDMAIKKAQKLGHDYSWLKYKPKSSIILPD